MKRFSNINTIRRLVREAINADCEYADEIADYIKKQGYNAHPRKLRMFIYYNMEGEIKIVRPHKMKYKRGVRQANRYLLG